MIAPQRGVTGEDELRRPEAAVRARFVPHALFFPSAVLHAAVALPWSVLAMLRAVDGPASLETPSGHAHELLLGYALAVVAGNQLPPMSRSRAVLLFGL